MTTLAEEAEAARLAAAAAAQAAQDAARRQFQAAARDAIRVLLVRADGTTFTLSDVGMKIVATDMDNGLVIWSDGKTSLAGNQTGDGWAIHLVQLVDGSWMRASEPLQSLADVGDALQVIAA